MVLEKGMGCKIITFNLELVEIKINLFTFSVK